MSQLITKFIKQIMKAPKIASRFLVLVIFTLIFFGQTSGDNFLVVGKAEAANITLSGTLYTDAGVTTAGASKTIKIAVGTTTPSVHSTTTVSNGTWQITNIDNANLSSTTPFTIWLDGDANDATTVVMGYSGSNITSIPLYYAYTIAHGTSSSATVDIGKFSFYDVDDDADILYRISATSTTVASNLLIKQGTFLAPTTTLSISGNYKSEGNFSHNFGNVYLTGSSKTLYADLNGGFNNLRIDGSYTMHSSFLGVADLIISSTGSFTATSSADINVSGNFSNLGSFTNNGAGLIMFPDTESEFYYYIGADSAGAESGGTGAVLVNTMVKSGDYLYVGKGGTATACSQTAGSAQGCELMVFDISNPTTPLYVAGRDISGSSGGTGNSTINEMIVVGNYLYIAKNANATACSQTAGSATGCELLVFDISSSTNPVYVAGRDAGGDSTGVHSVSMNSIINVGSFLYIGKAASTTACSQTAGSAAGCEIMVFDVSSSTNPIYRAGRDSDGSNTGARGSGVFGMAYSGNTVYVVKNGSGTACSQSSGTAGSNSCELMAFDISSTTNPTYVAGRDASGGSGGTSALAVNSIFVYDNYLYIAKTGNATACSQSAGSAHGCELMVFNISSTTNPTYVAGRDESGSDTGIGDVASNFVTISGNILYLGKSASSSECQYLAGSASGCEIVAFDISSSTNPEYWLGVSESGVPWDYSASTSVNFIYPANGLIYVGKSAEAGECGTGAGYDSGCEIMIFDTVSGYVSGNLTGSNSLAYFNNVQGTVTFMDNASTTDFDVSGTVNAPPVLTVSGSLYANADSNFVHNAGSVILSGTNQSITGTTTFYNLTKNVTSADTLTFGAGSEYYFDGTMTLNGTSSSLLSLRSSSNGSWWGVYPTVAVVSYLDVKDSNNFNGVMIVCDAGCVNSGNNIDWDFGASVLPLLSGIIYSGVGTSEYTSGGKTIKVVVNGTSTYTDTLDGGSGAWSVNADVATGSVVTIYVDGDATFRASLVTRMANASNTPNINLYKDYLIVRSEDGTSVPITNATLATYDSSDDSDIQFTVASNNLTQTAGQSLYVYSNTNYLPNGEVTVGKSLIATSTAVTNFSTTTFNFIATSTATVTATTTFGDMNFNSATGDWLITSNATTTNFTILDGTTTAPTSLTITGNFANADIFNSNSGTLYLQNIKDDVISYLAGRDTRGSSSGSGNVSMNTLLINGNYLYVGKAGNATACSQTSGNTGVQGCELMVFDISSSTNPVYVAGRDASGDDSGIDSVAMRSLVISGNYLYVAKNTNSSPCLQTASSAEGCELQVYDISSSTNPIYVAGRDSDGSSTGSGAVSFNQIISVGNYLYVVKNNNATACSQTAGSAIGCELMVFDISSSTNPVYVAGRDARGDSTGVGTLIMETIINNGNYLYVGKAGNATACSQTSGNTGVQGCELMVFDISSSTNPVYVAGRDASGSSNGTESIYINTLSVSGNYLYAGKDNDITACSQTAGSATGCELMVFDISSSTNPTYVAGRDADGSAGGATEAIITSLIVDDSHLYAGKDFTSCSDSAGCELMVFDISSSTNPIYGGGTNGTGGATESLGINFVTMSGNYLFVAKDASATACSQTADAAIGCELVVFSNATGMVSGNLMGSSALNNVSIQDGEIRVLNNATSSALTVASGSNLDVVNNLSVTGAYTNNGTATYDSTKDLYFISNSAQSISGNLTSDSVLPNTIFSGSGTKTFNNNASTSALTINSGSTLIAPSIMTVIGDYTNNGTFSDNNGTVEIDTIIDPVDYLTGIDISGLSAGTSSVVINKMAVFGNYLYVGKAASSTACSQTAGSVGVTGCELMVFDISSSTNPVYVAGRDSGGTATGTNANDINALAIKGNYLYAGKSGGILVFNISSPSNPVNITNTTSGTIYDLSISGNYLYVVAQGSATACGQTSGTSGGCELRVYDISSSTNPTYVAGRDSSGSSSGTLIITSNTVLAKDNYLYVGRNPSDGTACSQTAGSAGANDCELMIFDISSSTNPVYVAGRDGDGSGTGSGTVGINTIAISGNSIFVGKREDNTACSQTAGSAIGCELMVFDISSSTNPIYVAGRDTKGDDVGTGGSDDINSLMTIGDYLYVGKEHYLDSSPCTQVAGSAQGCELQIYDISSTTDPTFVIGLDSGGSINDTGPYIYSVVTDGNYVYIGKNGDGTACSQIAGSADGCEILILSDTDASVMSGSMIGSSDFKNLIIDGLVMMNNNASTTNLTLSTSSVLFAPEVITVAGNFSNTGAFRADGGLINLSGSSQSLISPYNTAFHSLTKSVTSADTLTFTAGGTYEFDGTLTLNGTSSNLLSLRSSSSTGEWYINPQATTSISYVDVQDSNNINVSTVSCDSGCLDSGNNTNWTFADATSLVSEDNYHFYVGQATTTLDQITITKLSSATDITTTNDLRISIATTTTNFRFNTSNTSLTFTGTASGKVSGTVSYENSGATLVINVTTNFAQDDTLIISGIQVGSFASVSTTSSQLSLYTSGSISGTPTTEDTRTINITGSIVVSDHTLGQVNNQFGFQNKADEAMFAFGLVPSSENATVTDIIFTLSGIQGLETDEFSDFKLYRDNNSDRAIDGGDDLIDGSGIMTTNGQHGAITFSSDFLVSGDKDYIVTADTSVIDRDDSLVIKLLTTGITAVGTSSAYASVIIGTPDDVQHERHGAAAGGSSARIGDDAPAGNGVVTGGGDNGGGGADQESDGENIVDDPNFMQPTATGDVHNEWTNPSNALLSDGTYATAGSNGLRQSYNGFSFGIAGGNTIQGIAVKLDASGSTANGTIDVSLSWDGGNSYTTAKATPTLAGSDIVYTVGGASDTWGRSWAVSEFDPANFRIRVTAVPSSNTLRLDALEIRVFHQTGGGGAGGGGGGGGI